MLIRKLAFSLLILTIVFWSNLNASKLTKMQVLDRDYLMLHFQDGVVEFVDDGRGPNAFHNSQTDPANSKAIYFGKGLNVAQVADVTNWRIQSADDPDFSATGIAPLAIWRKTKVNGMSIGPWGSSDWIFDYTKEHFIYLKLPHSLKENKTYTVKLNENINSDSTSKSITYDIFHCPSEAIHTNLVGYFSNSRVKSADLYHFLGDGGNRDYSEFAGNAVFIYNVATQESHQVGSVLFWMKNKRETQHNLTGSDVWNVDFTGFNQPGTYRLAIEGVGCSEDFEIRDDIYHDPYKLSVLGYFYMRIGQDNMNMTPVPRRPLFIQNQDPANCKIFVTDMQPYHSQWNSFANDDKWDKPGNWIPFKKAGNPTNPRAIGGHSDALDWDRHLGHVVNVYDLCLAYILSDGALNDDDLRIAESGNGIPDILDEARNEVDFWLNLRFEGGYSHGLTNPDKNNALYQAGNTPMAAWANALNSAMLAYCFQIAGLNDLKQAYQDSAMIAWNYAGNLPDPMLDTRVEDIRGADFEMMTAAYLYNLAGDTQYENLFQSGSVVTGSNSGIYVQGSHNQLWGTAAYLLTKRAVHYPDLHAKLKAAIISQAYSKETNNVSLRPSRRGYSNEQAWWQTNQDLHRTIIAHAVTDNPADQLNFLDALLLEADWGLGRNPLNLIQMTTASTELGNKRSIENCYTAGGDDGTPGLHPGHTPYLNIEGWGGTMVGSNPKLVFDKFYPNINEWPHASKYINTRFIWAHSEFTPRQTMRGKMLLYAYLYSLSKTGNAIPTDVLLADAGKDQKIVDQDENGREVVQLNGSLSYSGQNSIVSYHWILNTDTLATGKIARVELGQGIYPVVLLVADASGASATDTVKIEIVAPGLEQGANYDFETPAEIDDWIFQNWGEGSVPVPAISAEKARTGSHSLKISGNFPKNAEIVMKKSGALDAEIVAITYYVWIPQALVDSAKVAAVKDATKSGGIQNYLMHAGWNWRSKWVNLTEMMGDAWNKIYFEIPEDVIHSEIKEIGLACTLLNAGIGESSIYVDHILFSIAPVSIDEQTKQSAIPKEFKLFTNYPNPFNPETKIRYDLPKNTKVKITVYDVMGREVKTLVDCYENAGSYEAVFDGTQLASGVYLYRLAAGDYREVKKMILIR